tara:strand:- start:115 stop:453 length:339 start_codon:yes stop_codon:yes gene_type:complete
MSPTNNTGILLPEYTGDYIEILIEHQVDIRYLLNKIPLTITNETELTRAINKFISRCTINETEYFCLDVPEMDELILLATNLYFLEDVIKDLDAILFTNEQYYWILYNQEKD